MSPQEKREFNELQMLVQSLLEVKNVPFIESLKRRLDFLPRGANLVDLADVEDTTDAATGTVLKKTATTWQPGTDNT